MVSSQSISFTLVASFGHNLILNTLVVWSGIYLYGLYHLALPFGGGLPLYNRLRCWFVTNCGLLIVPCESG
jgi:hypothetical protein